MKTNLNIAAGKEKPIDLKENSFLVNIDTMYYDFKTPDEVEKIFSSWKGEKSIEIYCKSDIFEFMERTKLKFSNISIYRFLEHVNIEKIEYFIYLLSTITNKNSIVDVIVPNYTTLAKMLLNERIDSNFHSSNILITTELLNQPPDSHASIWTPERIKYFWELEGRFKVKETIPSFKFDGRSIYLRSIIERI